MGIELGDLVVEDAGHEGAGTGLEVETRGRCGGGTAGEEEGGP